MCGNQRLFKIIHINSSVKGTNETTNNFNVNIGGQIPYNAKNITVKLMSAFVPYFTDATEGVYAVYKPYDSTTIKIVMGGLMSDNYSYVLGSSLLIGQKINNYPALNFDNLLAYGGYQTVKLSGEEIKEYIEYSVNNIPGSINIRLLNNSYTDLKSVDNDVPPNWDLFLRFEYEF